jgi:hypothetical protein
VDSMNAADDISGAHVVADAFWIEHAGEVFGVEVDYLGDVLALWAPDGAVIRSLEANSPLFRRSGGAWLVIDMDTEEPK